MCKATIRNHSYQSSCLLVCFFPEPVGPSVSEPARLSDGCSAHCHQVHPVSRSVSLQASWVRRRLISRMLAVGTTTRVHAAEAAVEHLGTPVPIKGLIETCALKKMEEESFSCASLECLTCPLRVCLLSACPTAFLTLSSPPYFLVSTLRLL